MKTNDQTTEPGCVNGSPLGLLRIEGLFVFILSIFLYSRSGASWWLFALLLLVPDLSMTGYWLGARAVSYTHLDVYKRQVAARAVIFFSPLLVPELSG